ncbi:MAG: hypothetical protein AMS18_13795 [Gemmatimonas sp. SG8_17]|nr:MAG: hypothetical protein AMS18_13795 [Gemmatimonas sp. SG8_17]
MRPWSASFGSVAIMLWCQTATAQAPLPIELRPPDAVAAEQFTRIRSVRELSDGSLLAADRLEQRLVLVDWNADTVIDIGRVGGGPGEFQGIGFLYALSGDSTLFTDMFNARWSLLDGGAIVETFAEWRPLNRLFGATLYGADAFGHVLGTSAYSFSSEVPDVRRNKDEADTLRLLLGEWAGERVDTVALIKGPGAKKVYVERRPGRPTWVIPGTPFASEEPALLFPDGWIALARLEPYRVDWRRPDGRWIRGAPLPFEAVDVDDRNKCLAMERWVGSCDHDVAAIEDWPETVPPFVVLSSYRTPTLFAMPDGSVVITRQPTADVREPRYDIVDRGGRLTGVITLKSNEALIGFGAHCVYVLSTNEFDLQTLRRHPWP